METRFVRYRSFQPFRAAQEFEFLFGLRVQGRENGSDWEFERGDAGWILQAAGHPGLVRPEASGLRWP
jgi:hypothetical protein